MAKDILNEPRNKAALDAVARYVPTMPLPVLPPLQNDLWRIHSSAKGAPRREFELLEGEKVTDYERLEHVGDALLGAEVTLLIHEKYPKLSAGARTVAKSVLVCNLTLSLLAVSFHLEKQILSAVAQAYSHMTNPYIQACIFESAIAALYEEHGADALRDFLRAIYSQLLPVVVEALRPFYTSQAEDALPSRNFVGDLMEWRQAKGSMGRRTVDFGSSKEDPSGGGQRWSVEVTVADRGREELAEPRLFRGAASTVQKAKTEAAAKAFEWIEGA